MATTHRRALMIVLSSSLGCSLLILASALWGLVSIDRTYSQITRAIRRARSELDALELPEVVYPHQVEAVMGIVDLMAVSHPTIGLAWQRFTDTILEIQHVPRTTSNLSRT